MFYFPIYYFFIYRVPELPVHLELQVKPIFQGQLMYRLLPKCTQISTQNGSHFLRKKKAMALRTQFFVQQFRKMEKVPPVLTLENSKRAICSRSKDEIRSLKVERGSKVYHSDWYLTGLLVSQHEGRSHTISSQPQHSILPHSQLVQVPHLVGYQSS